MARGTLKTLPHADSNPDIGSTCPPFNSLGIIVEYLFTLAVGDRSCVLVRYIWPLPNLFTLAQGAFGWTYAGGAEPFVDTPGVNCEEAVTVGTHELICVGVGPGEKAAARFYANPGRRWGLGTLCWICCCRCCWWAS